MAEPIKAAILGARGHVGVELIQLLDAHPQVQLVAAYSRSHAGKPVQQMVAGFSDPHLAYADGPIADLPNHDLDVLFVALPDGLAKQHTALWQQMAPRTLIIDLSADHRFDDDWTYGQPETCEQSLAIARLIANPGCYATGLQLGWYPLLPYLQDNDHDVPTAFGVSGYSGAGTTPSDKNNPKRLADNLLAYKPTDHTHEREVTRVLGRPIRFMPHVAAHFRGIHLTLSGKLNLTLTAEELFKIYQQFYADCPLIQVQTTAPEVQQIAQQHGVIIGGFAASQAEPGHLVLNVCLDNLLKGAATQAVQNMNLALAASHQTQAFTGII
ncbi:N-acetyl-gamma-glutamyl-phosphate reductase [Marinicella meishanensis]|uniref:N-acetyl-gamma-glutamyl-phosphate reductase n=1 Tax=Marinicella meishanensis TaxID=2873263 RepID=UPI001CC00CED|nr:N-acetyl-gamma-glutamyl-phosphate reductase [Marinicella sp. NBU2979]